MSSNRDKVIRLYDVKPEMALEHLKRSTGLDFSDPPQSLVALVKRNQACLKKVDQPALPILIDVVDVPVFKKRM